MGVSIRGHSDPHLHSPCPRCGYATRYKQFGPMRCACPNPKPRPRRVICSVTLTEHCPYEGEEEKGSECKNLADDLPPGSPSGPPLRIAARYAAGRPRAPRRD
jgi:hypothetical protein